MRHAILLFLAFLASQSTAYEKSEIWWKPQEAAKELDGKLYKAATDLTVREELANFYKNDRDALTIGANRYLNNIEDPLDFGKSWGAAGKDSILLEGIFLRIKTLEIHIWKRTSVVTEYTADAEW